MNQSCCNGKVDTLANHRHTPVQQKTCQPRVALHTHAGIVAPRKQDVSGQHEIPRLYPAFHCRLRAPPPHNMAIGTGLRALSWEKKHPFIINILKCKWFTFMIKSHKTCCSLQILGYSVWLHLHTHCIMLAVPLDVMETSKGGTALALHMTDSAPVWALLHWQHEERC